MYFDAPEGAAEEVVMAADAKAVLGLNGLGVVVIGLLPAPLMALCFDVIQRSLAG
jgi:NADH-quinone oxidoreductase subunit N